MIIKFKTLCCRKCKERLTERIVRHKSSLDDCRNIQVVEKKGNGFAVCLCMSCGHKWQSKSQEAINLLTIKTGK